MTRGQLAGIGIAAGGAAVLGAPLEWARASAGFFSIGKAGTEGDGQITLVFGLVMVVLGILIATSWKTRVPVWFLTVIGGLVTAVGGYDLFDIVDKGQSLPEGGSVTPGVGLILTLAGGVVGLVSGILLLGRTKPEPTPLLFPPPGPAVESPRQPGMPLPPPPPPPSVPGPTVEN